LLEQQFTAAQHHTACTIHLAQTVLQKLYAVRILFALTMATYRSVQWQWTQYKKIIPKLDTF